MEPNNQSTQQVPIDDGGQTTTEGQAPSARTWHEEVEVAGHQLVERIKELMAEGNVRRLIIRNKENRTLLEIPLTAGVAAGGVVTLIAPLLAALGALAALIAEVRVEIVRDTTP